MQLNLHPRPLLTHADAGMLDQVMLNLVINARDAMPGGGRLTVRVDEVDLDESAAVALVEGQAGRYGRLSVSDTGTGMSEDVKARAFEPFFTTKPLGRGSGLGLSQVQGFVTQSGGRVAIESAPGWGASIRLYLPQGAAQPARQPEIAEVA